MVNPFIINRAKGFYQFGLLDDGSFMQQEASLMSFAFSAELALKAFLDVKCGTHDLLRIFEKISGGRQDWLSEHYGEATNCVLLDDLARCRNVFVEFRYYHERNGFMVDSGTMQKLARVLTSAGEKAVADRPGMEFFTHEVHFPGGLKLPGPEDPAG